MHVCNLHLRWNNKFNTVHAFCEYYFDVRENKEKDLKPLMMYFEGHSRAKKN